MVVRRSIEIRAPSAMGVQYSKAVANLLFYDGSQTIGQAKPLRLESIDITLISRVDYVKKAVPMMKCRH